MKKLKLLVEIARVLVRSGLIPSLGHWFGAARAFWECGPSFAFLGRLAAVRFPDYEAFIDDEGSLTFRELNEKAEALARFLIEKDGVKQGQQVGILCFNHRGFVLSLLAVTRLGADVLPLNPKAPADVLEEILSRQKVSLLIHDSASAVDLPQSIKKRLWNEDLDSPTPLGRVGRAGQLVVLTSGTTGVSKGIRRRPTVGELLPVTAGLLRDLPLKLHRPTVLAIPLYHGYGIATLALSLTIGSPLLTGRKYDVGPLLNRMVKTEPALLVTVPTLLWRWQQDSVSGENLEAIITGSAPLSPQLCSQLLKRLGPIIYNLYGSTESGLIAMATPDMLSKAPGCVGRPLPGNQVRLSEISGGVGELSVKGPLVLKPGPDGWRDTGDLGRYDAHGNLFVCGRADGMIVSGGENVFPHELEEALARHPGLKDFAVLAVPDEEFGHRLIAAVVVNEVAVEELKEWLKDKLEGFKRPKETFELRNIPRNALGKVDRRALMAELGYY